jgi:hypothetical protein
MSASYSPAAALPAFHARAVALIARLLARALPEPLLLGKGILTRLERALVLAWLRPLERVVRVLIIFRALALPVIGPLPVPRQDEGGLPSSLDVRIPGFSVVAGGMSGGSGPSSEADRQETFSAWPLVERLEAVLRAIEDPDPHIARLARCYGRSAAGLERPARPKRGTLERRGLSELAAIFAAAEARELLGLAAAQDTS